MVSFVRFSLLNLLTFWLDEVCLGFLIGGNGGNAFIRIKKQNKIAFVCILNDNCNLNTEFM